MSDVEAMLSWLRGVLDAEERAASDVHVLAVVAAHRKILDAYGDALVNDGYVWMGGWASCSDECAMAALGEVVKVIVSAYANRDGYRPEWGTL